MLSRHQVLEIQDALIKEYQKQEFQDKLHAAVAAAGTSAAEQLHARHEVCLKVQGPIIEKYGFEPTLRGVHQTFGALTDDMRRDPEIEARIVTMSALVERRDPRAQREQEKDAKTNASLELSHAHQGSRHPAVHVEAAEGRLWRVVGGTHHHGVMVRKGKELSSPVLSDGNHEARLSTGAVVHEMELFGERLHYKKITGDGPDYGWVSINLHGSALLEPVASPLKVE